MTSYQSAPVDLDNPSFASLLSALKEVHEGKLPPEVLLTYQHALNAELAESRAGIESLQAPPDADEALIQAVEDQKRMTDTALGMSQLVVDSLGEYVIDPTQERMAACVQLFVQAQHVMGQLHELLDAQAQS
jgi:hypothetical protein